MCHGRMLDVVLDFGSSAVQANRAIWPASLLNPLLCFFFYAKHVGYLHSVNHSQDDLLGTLLIIRFLVSVFSLLNSDNDRKVKQNATFRYNPHFI